MIFEFEILVIFVIRFLLIILLLVLLRFVFFFIIVLLFVLLKFLCSVFLELEGSLEILEKLIRVLV